MTILRRCKDDTWRPRYQTLI